MNEDENFWRLLSASKPDVFWHGQKKRILKRIEGAEIPRVLWRLAPVMVAAGLLVMLQLHKNRAPAPEPIPPASEWGLLQNLDLLVDMDRMLEEKGARL
jgi:hypothetical protein